jgi:hypothetical protein
MSTTVEEAPENATIVPYDDDRIANVTPVQRAIDNAIEADGNESGYPVSGSDLNAAEDALFSTPSYDPGADSPYRKGHYVEKNGTVVVLWIQVRQ